MQECIDNNKLSFIDCFTSPSLLTEGVALNIGEEVLGTFCLMIFSGNVIKCKQ